MSKIPELDWALIDKRLKAALREDVGSGDITSKLLIPASLQGRARIMAKEEGVLCGMEIARRVFSLIDDKIKFTCILKDGASIKPGDVAAKISGPMRSILTAERTALNILQRLSGIATQTSQFAAALAPHKAKIYDTRKTTPLWRDLEKYAVAIGGGENYRFGLYDMIMIKDNHTDTVGGLGPAIERAIRGNRNKLKIVTEARTLDDVKTALQYPIDVIMLDNMTVAQIKRALEMTLRAKCEVEVSGNITLARAKKLAALGVKRMSAGSITHSVKALDLSLKYEK
jgi:nicotinate-nucleotide pyrophosphorylase (carboxylating)